MTDIVEQLRKRALWWHDKDAEGRVLDDAAADEIERLRAEYNSLVATRRTELAAAALKMRERLMAKIRSMPLTDFQKAVIGDTASALPLVEDEP